MIRVGVVGTGDWGRNLVRVFATLPGARLVRVADLDGDRLADAARDLPGVETSLDPASVTGAADLDAAVIATPAASHHAHAAAALDRGLHCFVEKPLCLSAADAADLVRRADAAGRVLMVGHLLLYHPAVEALLERAAAGHLGTLRYASAVRVNLGKVRSDESALWSLGPHDLALMLRLFGGPPESVSARGAAWLRPGVEDLVFVNLRWPGGRLGQVEVSWLHPRKVRRLTVVGDLRMATFDDMEPSEKLRIYDAGAGIPGAYVGPGEALAVRYGDVSVPRIELAEPLRRECADFIDCVREGRKPRADGASGLAVVEVLEAATASLAADGAPVAPGGGTP